MVTLVQVREYMRRQADEDKSKKSIQVSGSTIEEALSAASIELGLPVSKLDYEIISKGQKNVFGKSVKKWVLVAYQSASEDELLKEDDLGGFSLDEFDQKMSVPDQDGKVFVRLTSGGVLLKATKPMGSGRPATVDQAIDLLHQRAVTKFHEDMVKKVIKQASDTFVPVGEFVYNPANDAILSVEIADLEMKAYMTIRAPGPGGIDLLENQIISFLKNNGVVFGISEEKVKEYIEYPEYGTPILVAEGEKPANGDDAVISYSFELEKAASVKLKEKNGKVDFKELNLVQNVVEGQVLATKKPAQQGKSGRTVTGKMLPAKSGKNVEIQVGKNVTLSADGNSATAAINGQALVVSGKINVEPIYVVPGDVNLRTGNILFLGTVLVKGSVTDGFSVKASGNIEVMGNVGKCDLDCDGDIIVHQGINGKTGGLVKSGKTIWAKFIENSKVEAGEYVVVSDGIINSYVDAQKKIVCNGKRATIVGGRLRVGEEVNAKTLGSIAGSETILEAGYDPKNKAKMDELEKKITEVKSALEEIRTNINTLENIKRQRKKLPDDREAQLQSFVAKEAELQLVEEKLAKEIQEIYTYLNNLKITGKVSAGGKVFAGVKIYIKDAYLEVKNEYRAITFINEGNLIKVTKYEEVDEDLTRKR